MTNWKKRYLASDIRWAAVASHNPQRGLVSTNLNGSYQLFAWDVPTGNLRQITNNPIAIANGEISADGETVYYHQDKGGNEIGHYMQIPWHGEGEPQDITPDLPLYSSWNITVSPDGRWLGFSSADEEGFRVWALPSDLSAPPRALFHSPHLTFGPRFSADGTLAYFMTSPTGSLDSVLRAVEVETAELVGELSAGEEASIEFGPPSPHLATPWIAATSNETGIERPLIWNPRTGERRELVLDGLQGAIAIMAWSPDGQQLILDQLHAAQQTLYRYDLATDTLHALPQTPAGVFSGWRMMWTADELILTWQDAATPAQLVALDSHTGALRRTLAAGQPVPAGRPWRSISLIGAQGDEVQGWLITPEGAGPFPTILHTHGGPTAVMLDYFSAEGQAWVDMGFAFFSLNYHGSVTFGKSFEESIRGNLGDLEVTDMEAAYHWLVANNIALPHKVFLVGGSYGGYLTLQALGKAPQLWAGGIATVAIADWALMYEDQAENLKGYQRALFGGTPSDTAEAHRNSSPITYAANLQAPILVIQGSNDTRCPARQMQAYEKLLQELGKSIQVHWFDAGHGSLPQALRIAHQELAMNFALSLVEP